MAPHVQYNHSWAPGEVSVSVLVKDNLGRPADRKRKAKLETLERMLDGLVLALMSIAEDVASDKEVAS